LAPAGDRIALVVAHVARVLAEHADIDAPVVPASTAAQADLPLEREGIDDRGPLHEGDEPVAGQPLERVRRLVLADAEVGGVEPRAVVLDVGVLDVDLPAREVGLELVAPAVEEIALDAEACCAQLRRVVVSIGVVLVAERSPVD
jgi:hypothetical protein